MSKPYWLLINRVLTRGQMSNSYKPALLRALARYGASKQEQLEVPWTWLAEQFVRYYWPLAVRYRVRQATDPLKEPIVVRLIKQLDMDSRTTLDQFRRRYRPEFKSLINRLATPGSNCCLDQVVPRFHTLRGGAPAFLYEQNDRAIQILPKGLSFLQEHHPTLRLLAIGRWVEFTEKYSLSPRLWEKIEGHPKRPSLSSYRQSLLRLCVIDACFYCGMALESDWDLDHFLPWSFVLEHKLWNLVPSCKACNGSKSDGVPASESLMEKLNGRNRSIFQMLTGGRNSCKKGADFKEWSSDRLSDHIAVLYRNAVAEGFPTWERSDANA